VVFVRAPHRRGGCRCVAARRRRVRRLKRCVTTRSRSVGVFDPHRVVAKRADQPYQPGKRSWIKVKRYETADLVVAGYVGDPENPSSLLLGTYDETGQLKFVGATKASEARVGESDEETPPRANGARQLRRRTVARAQSVGQPPLRRVVLVATRDRLRGCLLSSRSRVPQARREFCAMSFRQRAY
jgi:hypothetical protein